mgnify:FL=1
MKLSTLKLAVLGALLTPMTSVFAEEAPVEAASDFSVSGNVGMYSDYIFRGYTQTKHMPAIQGGFDIEHSSGLYLGTWASNVKWTTEGGYMDDNDIEIDIYGGWAGDVGPVSLDVGFLQFIYPGDNVNGGAETNASELYVGASKDFGFASAGVTYYYMVSSGGFGFDDMEGSDYVSLDLDVPLGDTPAVASFHVGHQTFEGAGNDPYDYTDWKINLDYAINGTYSVGAFYTDTDQDRTFWTYNNEYLGEAVGGVYLSAGF